MTPLEALGLSYIIIGGCLGFLGEALRPRPTFSRYELIMRYPENVQH